MGLYREGSEPSQVHKNQPEAGTAASLGSGQPLPDTKASEGSRAATSCANSSPLSMVLGWFNDEEKDDSAGDNARKDISAICDRSCSEIVAKAEFSEQSWISEDWLWSESRYPLSLRSFSKSFKSCCFSWSICSSNIDGAGLLQAIVGTSNSLPEASSNSRREANERHLVEVGHPLITKVSADAAT